MQFQFTIRKGTGRMVIHRRADFDNHIASLGGDDKDFQGTITIEKVKRKRSNEVNRYWWGVIIPVVQRGMNELGNEFSKEETHEFLKANFNFKEVVNEETAEIYRVPRSTATMNGSDFWELIDKVIRFAAEYLHEQIELPGDQAEMNFNN